MTITTPTTRRKKWPLSITEDEFRMKIRRMNGVEARFRPKPGIESRSTKFGVWDICLLARADWRGLMKFLAGKKLPPKGGSWLSHASAIRVNDIIDKIMGGYISKSQYGVYHFHDVPLAAKVVRQMQVNLDIGRITGAVLLPPKPKKMPGFDILFGRR